MATRVNEGRGSLLGSAAGRHGSAFERSVERAAAQGHRPQAAGWGGAQRLAAVRDWSAAGGGNHPPTVAPFNSTIQRPYPQPGYSRP